MGGGWPAQRRIDDFDDIDAWMAQRNANVALRQQAETAGRDLWNQATRDGQNLSATQPSDLVAIGADALSQKQPTGFADSRDPSNSADSEYGRSLQEPNSDLTVAPRSDPGPIVTTPPSYGFATARPGDSISRLLGASDPAAIGRFVNLNGLDGRSSTLQIGHGYAVPTDFRDASPDEIATGNHLLRSDNTQLAAAHAPAANDGQANLFAQRLNSGLNAWTGEAPDYPGPQPAAALPPERPWWDRSAPIKALAGTGAFVVGLPVGLASGAMHLGVGIGDGLDLGARLLDPHDAENHLPGESAREEVLDKGQGILDYGQARIENPNKIVGDFRHLGHWARVNYDPFPIAPTLGEQLRRNFQVGQNFGEAGFNFGTALDGGELVKGLQAADAVSDAAKIPEYLRPGAPPELASYLGEPYKGRGAHFVPRRATFPETIAGIPLPDSLVGKPLLPKAYMDGRFNVWKPAGISRGDFNVGHYRRDDRMYGTRLPKDVDGGRGWSGNRLGLERFGPVGRIWHGAPLPLKAAAGGGSAALAAGVAGVYDYRHEGVPE